MLVNVFSAAGFGHQVSQLVSHRLRFLARDDNFHCRGVIATVTLANRQATKNRPYFSNKR